MVNLFRTGLLIAALTALFLAVGYWAAGPQGMLVALLLAAAMNFLTCWSADTIVLTLYGAREADAIQVPVPMRAVRDLASRAGLPMLKVYLIDSEQPNAFATGRDPAHSAVGVPAACYVRSPGCWRTMMPRITAASAVSPTIPNTIAAAISRRIMNSVN
jgi:heat shock protein HtpX